MILAMLLKCSRQFVAGAATQNNGRRGDCIKQSPLGFIIPLGSTGIFIPNNALNTPPETVPLDRTNGAAKPLKWCMVTAAMVH